VVWDRKQRVLIATAAHLTSWTSLSLTCAPIRLQNLVAFARFLDMNSCTEETSKPMR